MNKPEKAQENKHNNTNYSFIFKIILIGNSNTGKTSLINRYINNTFDDKYMCTVGVDFMMKKIQVDNIDLKLQIWDTAGMEKYKQITTSYYRGAQVAVVVFDLTCHNTFEAVKKWIDDFLMICNKNIKPIIALVGNKCDLANERKVTQEEIDKFMKINSNSYTYIEASAKSGVNVEELFIKLSKELLARCKSALLNKKNNGDNSLTPDDGVEVKITDTFHSLISQERQKKKCYC